MLSSLTFTFFIILRSSFNLLFIILVYIVFCVFTHTNSKSIFIV